MTEVKKKTNWWVPVVLSTLFFGGCVGAFFGDHIVADERFIALCESETDFRLYESVAIEDQYFLERPESFLERGRLDNIHQVYDDFEYIRFEYFDANFIRVYQEPSIVDDIGPIEKYTTKVIRKSDGKVLSEVSSFANQKGWLFRYLDKYIQTSRDRCPKGRDKNDYPLFDKSHDFLKNTFTKEN